MLTMSARIFCVRGTVFLAFVWTMIIIIVIWTVGFFFASMLQCYPISENWTGLGGTVETCIDENMMYLGQAFSDSITDLIILIMPIPYVNSHVYYISTLTLTATKGLGTSAASKTEGRREWHVLVRNTVSLHCTRPGSECLWDKGPLRQA